MGFWGLACSGKRQTLLAARFGAACVLLDLEEFDAKRGLALLEALRELPQSRAAFLVALGPLGHPAYGAACFSSGFDHYLVKPVCERELEGLLGALPDFQGKKESDNIQRVYEKLERGVDGYADTDCPF
jgi:CheY-like chemotaxis protein